MTAFTKLGTVVIWTVFVLYLALLLKLLVFSRTPGSARSLNLIPFASISAYLFSGSAAVKRLGTNLLMVVCASVAVEFVQGILGSAHRTSTMSS